MSERYKDPSSYCTEIELERVNLEAGYSVKRWMQGPKWEKRSRMRGLGWGDKRLGE